MISGVRAQVLVVTVHFDVSGESPWLVDDLVAALVQKNCEVDVLVGDAKRPYPRGLLMRSGKLRVFSLGSTRPAAHGIRQYLRHLATLIRFRTIGLRRVQRSHYDLCVFFSSGLLTAGLPGAVRRAGICDKLLMVLWDFFPIHQMEIGRLPKWRVMDLLRRAEFRTLRDCDLIAVMTPRNGEFLRKYHPKYRGSTVVMPPWGGGAQDFQHLERSAGTVRIIFGGQLAPGRGLDTLLDAAAELTRAGCDAEIVIAGDGPDRERLEARIVSESLSNVRITGQLGRESYRRLLHVQDAGVAITVPNVSIASFPSKIGEYCWAGLPVIVCTEGSSDVGTIAEQAGWGLHVDAGDALGLAQAIATLKRLKFNGELRQMRAAAEAYAKTEMSPDRAAEVVLSAINA